MQIREQINLYIAEQPEWQRKLLVRLRQLIHSAEDDIEETWRWNGPHFDHEGIMLGIAGFKSFVSVWFHKGALLKDAHGLFEALEKGEEKEIRVYKVREGEPINEKAFLELVKQAMKLNQAGMKITDARPARKALVLPPELEKVLLKDEKAWTNWESFTYTEKKEYVEWVTDAKQEETRKRRIAKSLEMIREGQGRNDKYKVS